jgi:hypothetical protein
VNGAGSRLLESAQIQVASFSGDRCREIEAALIASGHLNLKPSTLELRYPYGGSWQLETDSDRAVIAVSARPVDDARWILKIQPSARVRPHVVHRSPPSESQLQHWERMCYDLALVIHGALHALCPDLTWAIGTDAEPLTRSSAPIPPTT